MPLIPLTGIDSGPAAVSMCMGFVFSLPEFTSPADRNALVRRLETSAERVVRKWPLLAGKPVWQDERWVIDVPSDLDTLNRPLVQFTTTVLSEPYHIAASVPDASFSLSTSRSGILPQPRPSLFRAPNFPVSLADHATRNLPLLNLHVTQCADALCVGVLLSHGLFDGTGLGLVLRALDAELHGKSDSWTAPPMAEVNPLATQLAALVDNSDPALAGADAERTDPPVFKWSWRMPTLGGTLRFVASMVWEKVWWKSEARWLFLRNETVKYLVESTKREVKQLTDGKEYVSTGDVLAAWAIKAAHSDESTSRSCVSPAALFSARALLSPSLTSYPHGAAFPYSLFPTPLPLRTLAQTSTASLALTMRRQLVANATLANLRHIQVRSGGAALVPVRDWPGAALFLPWRWWRRPHVHRWLASNQTALGMASLALPSPSSAGEETDLPLRAYYLLGEGPVEVDGVLPFQQTAAGVTSSATMRRSRWESLRRRVEELEREAEAAKKAE
ncbi:hypothetical protein JCM10207_005562 [Rhodosporidiobolus poonsookiae]